MLCIDYVRQMETANNWWRRLPLILTEDFLMKEKIYFYILLKLIILTLTKLYVIQPSVIYVV